MEKGKVKWYNEKRKYGFIMREDSTDIFVHQSGLKVPTICEYQMVWFDIQQTKRGLKAVNVTIEETRTEV